MKNHFKVTITDDNGVKEFNVHRFAKKAISYALLFLGFLTLFALGAILYLNYSIDTIQTKKNTIKEAYNKLQIAMEDTTKDLFLKKRELEELSDSLLEIETLIGIAPLPEKTLEERVNTTKLNSENMATLLQLIPSGSPIEYNGITSKFGYRVHPTLNRREFHRGSDMRAKMRTPVYATADGIIEYAGKHVKSGFGNLVIVQHAFGFRSYFGHLHKIVIKSNRFVKKGDLIAYTGNSGLSSGPHLHYEIRFMHNAVNPFYFIKWSVENYNDIFLKEKKIPWKSLIAATENFKVVKPTQVVQQSPLVLKSVEQ